MPYNFDTCPDRMGTGASKHENMKKLFGEKAKHPLWVADMDFQCPAEILDALHARIDHGVFGYTYTYDTYLDAIVNWEKRRHNFHVEKEWILFSPGVVPGVYWPVQLFTSPGDPVLLSTPVYTPFFSAIEKQGRRVVTSELMLENGHYSIDFEDFEKTIKDEGVGLYIFCSPHNPTGRVWTREELEKVVEICARNGVLIVSDEIHQDIVYPGHKHIPTASLNETARDITITVTAASKTFNVAGLQNAYLIVPDKERRDKIRTYAAEQLDVMNGNVLGYTATMAAYNHGEKWLEELLVYLKGNYDLIAEYMAKMPKLKLTPIEATYLAWVDFRETGLSDEEFQKFLQDECFWACNMGIIYGEHGKGFFRINFGLPRANLKAALEDMQSAYNSRF